MKVICSQCRRSFNIPEERLPRTDSIAFPCPICKAMIEIDLRGLARGENGAMVTAKPAQAAAAGAAAAGLPSGEQLMKKILQTVKDIPPMPQTALKAHEIIKNPHASFEDLAQVMEMDQAIATRVLKMANSPYYGMSGSVSSIKHASTILGLKVLEELIVAAWSSQALGKRMEGYGLETGDLWQHSMAVAFGAKIIAASKEPTLANDAFSAGLIHDVGKLVLDPYIKERRGAFEAFLQERDRSFLEAEKGILGFDHGEIAAELCDNWHVPRDLAAAIRYHHRPQDSSGSRLAYIVHLADVTALMSGMGAGIDGMQYELDPAALNTMDMTTDDINGVMVEVVQAVQAVSAEVMQV